MPLETDGAETDAPEMDGAETDGTEMDAPETDVPKTDGAETDAPETDVPETEEGGDGGRLRWMSLRRKVCFLNIVEGFSGCYCLISFECCVWVQRCTGLVDCSSGVCVHVWVCICVCVCVS